jgi:hypothetical protein
MLGVPGASYLGAAVAAGLDAAAVSPDGAAALATQEGQLTLVSGLRGAAPASAPVSGGIADADRIVWSPDGATAAVYSSRGGFAQVLRRMGAVPEAGAAIEFAGAVTALAVSSQGDLLAGTDAGLYLLAPGSAPRLVAAARPAALAIRGADVFVADTGNDRILLVENFASAPAASVFTEGADTPVGLQVASGGKRLLVASAASKTLRAYDVAARTLAGQADLDCAPTELRAFGGRDMWLLNSDTSGTDPLWVGTSDGQPAAWFVPAGREQ